MVKLALIGKGNWGQNYIKTIGQGLKNISLPSNNIFGRDYLKNLTKLNADGVIIASPTSTHFQVARNLIQRGFKKLLIEKPLTQTLSEALKLQKLAKESAVSIMVGHIQLYDPAIIVMEKNLRLVGAIKKMNYEGLKSHVRIDGTTVIQEWGPHPSYLFMHFLSRMPKKVFAERLSKDNMMLTYDFGNINAVAKIGWTYPRKRRIFRIDGERGRLILDGSTSVKKLTFFGSDGHKKVISFSKASSPLKNEILEFASMIKNGKDARTPLTQGIEVMRLIDIAESNLQGNSSGF